MKVSQWVQLWYERQLADNKLEKFKRWLHPANKTTAWWFNGHNTGREIDAAFCITKGDSQKLLLCLTPSVFLLKLRKNQDEQTKKKHLTFSIRAGRNRRWKRRMGYWISTHTYTHTHTHTHTPLLMRARGWAIAPLSSMLSCKQDKHGLNHNPQRDVTTFSNFTAECLCARACVCESVCVCVCVFIVQVHDIINSNGKIALNSKLDTLTAAST